MHAEYNQRGEFDAVLQQIADYVVTTPINSDLAYQTARWCLLDSLGCAMLALNYPECTKVLGPLVPGMRIESGARVPGTSFELDPVQAAFNLGTTIRWLDFNDTWLAAEWGHPSDNLGAILMCADYVSRQRQLRGENPMTMREVLTALIKAHEIQGVMALANSFNRVGLDHVILVKLASTALAMHIMGGDRAAILNALAQVFVDGQSLRTYRHAPNVGSRKSWAAGDATSRAVRLALLTQAGEKGCPTALTAKTWGFYDVAFGGKPFVLERPLESYVMENVLFKISYPAEFHAQTAVEAAIRLHTDVKDRLHDIDRIELTTHESAIRIINKAGPLHNPADRDHCLQYMVAVGLIFGELTADHYEDKIAHDPRLDALREKMQVAEDKRYTTEYMDADKRSIANAIQVFFKDGSSTARVEIEYPLGHRRRRAEGFPVLEAKFKQNLQTRFDASRVDSILTASRDLDQLAGMPVPEFVDLWVV